MIRTMRLEDLDQVEAIEKQCFSDPWTLDSMQYELQGNPFSTPYVLLDDEDRKTIIGYAYLWVTFEQAQLANIAIDPKYRKQNKGSQLLKHLIEVAKAQECETMTLEVRVSNQTAIALYEKFGFTPINVIKRYYSDGEDAILMGIGF